jgi:plastocyanin
MTWRVRAPFVVLIVVATIGPLAPRPAEADTARVVLADLHFTPPRLEIALGDTVVWTAGDEGHTVTARDGTFDSSPRGLMAEGDEYRYRFRVPGAYPYFCRVHQARGMQGEIVVVDPSAPTTTSATQPTPVTAAAPPPSAEATTTTTGPPATTTSRPLATSSTTSMSVATATTALPGDSAVPQEAPALNANARVVGSPVPDAGLEAQGAAARRSGGSGTVPAVAAGLGVLVVGAAGGGALLRARRRRPT